MKMTEPKPRYVLFGRLAGGEIESFLARAPNGDRVMVHLVAASSTRGRTILEGLDRLGAGDRARVRAIDSIDGAPVIVTDVLGDFASLPAWLDACLRPPPVPETGEGDAAGGGEDDSGPGEFTRLFKLGGASASSSGASRSTESGGSRSLRQEDRGPDEERAGRAEGGEPDEAPDGRDAEPGEFTRLFLMQDALERSRERADEAEPPRSGRRDPDQPADDAGTQAGDEPRQAARGRPAADEPGDFTSLFSPGAAEKERDRRSGPPGWDALRDPPGWSGSRSKESSPLGEDGEDYLERLADTTRDPDRDAGSSSIGFGATETDRGEPEPVPGPSRYTQVLAGSGGPPAAPRSPEAPKSRSPEPESSTESAAEESSPPSKRPYVIAVVVIVVVAIAFIALLAWLARDSGPGEEPAGADEPAAAVSVTLPAGAG